MSALGREQGSTAAADAAIIAAAWKIWITFLQAPIGATVSYIEGLAQDWGSAPYTQGVYSFPMQDTSLSSTNNKRRDLKAPVANQRIFLLEKRPMKPIPRRLGRFTFGAPYIRLSAPLWQCTGSMVSQANHPINSWIKFRLKLGVALMSRLASILNIPLQ